MDSKVRKLTILVAMLAVITVLGVVILTNWSRIKPTSAQNVESVSEAETDSGDITSEFGSGFAGADPSKQQGQNLTAFLSDERSVVSLPAMVFVGMMAWWSLTLLLSKTDAGRTGSVRSASPA